QRPVVDSERPERRACDERAESHDHDARRRPVIEARAAESARDVAVGDDVADVRRDLAAEAEREPALVRILERAEHLVVVRELADARDRADDENHPDDGPEHDMLRVDPEDGLALGHPYLANGSRRRSPIAAQLQLRSTARRAAS